MAKTTLTPVRTTPAQKEAFKQACQDLGIDMAHVLREAMRHTVRSAGLDWPSAESIAQDIVTDMASTSTKEA